MKKDDSLFYSAAAVGLALAGMIGMSYLIKSNTCGKCGRLGKHDHPDIEGEEKPKEAGCGCSAKQE